MKSIKKYLFITAALAAVFGFVACGEEGSSTVATYKADSAAVTLTFLDDDTWSITGKLAGEEKTIAEGTYAGEPSENGDILMTTTKMMYNNGKLVDVQDVSQKEVSIVNGKMHFMSYDFIRQ